MPIFQRQYSWDAKNGKALAYFDFLSSDSDNTHLDYILAFSVKEVGSRSSNFIELTDLQKVQEVFLADGQHRLVTALLAVMAIVNFFSRPENKVLRDDMADEVAFFEDLLAKGDIEVVLRPCEAASLKKTLNGQLARLDALDNEDASLRTRISEARAAVKELPKDQRAGERSRLRDEQKRGLGRSQVERKAILDSAIYQGYASIVERLKDVAQSNNRIIKLVYGLIKRYDQVTGTLEVFIPGQSDVDESALTGHCFNLFTAKNGHTSPLTAEDLFLAYAGDKKDDVSGNDIGALIDKRLFKEKRGLETAFGIKDVASFLSARAIWDNVPYKEDARLSQIRQDFFSKSEAAPARLAHYNRILTHCGNASMWFLEPHVSSTLRRYFHIFDSALSKNATYVFKLRYVRDAINDGIVPAEKDMLNLFKLLVLLELAQSYYEPGKRRAILARDIPEFEKPVLQKALKYCHDHFNPSGTADFKTKVAQHLASFPFGKVGRDLGKMLLLTAEFAPGRAIPLADDVYANIAYEHVLPLNYADTVEDDAELKRLQASLGATDDDERERVINLLGNAAILQKAANSELQDLLPSQKLEATNKKSSLSQAWSPLSLRDLQSTCGSATQNEPWDGAYIQKRTQRIAEAIVKFLLDDTMLALL